MPQQSNHTAANRATPPDTPLSTHLHHQRRVGGGGHAARRKVDHRQAAQRLGLPHQLHGGAQLLGQGRRWERWEER